MLSTGYSSKFPVSHTGSLWKGECPLLWQVGWQSDRLPHPSSFWASTSSIPDCISLSHCVPLKCWVYREYWAMSPHSSTRQPPSDQCSGGASSIPGHFGSSIQCKWWPGLSLLQSTANSGGGQNRWAAGRWEERESDMDAGDSWARGLLVWSRTLPRSISVCLIERKNAEPDPYKNALILCNQNFKLSQNCDTSAPALVHNISDTASHMVKSCKCKRNWTDVKQKMKMLWVGFQAWGICMWTGRFSPSLGTPVSSHRPISGTLGWLETLNCHLGVSKWCLCLMD